ncbi:MAG: serine hydrolase [Pseudomonadota bacterium]
MCRCVTVLFASIVLALTATTSQADNGQLAHALPSTNAPHVDGDLSDWPDHLPRYAIAFDGDGARRAGNADFDAMFRTTYDAATRSLYVALEVLDDVHSVADSAQADWSAQDGVILYLDERHETRGSGPILYSVTGEHRRLLSDENSWDPAVRQASWEQVSLATTRGDDRRTLYEWRIVTTSPLAPGLSFGLDFLLSDDDTPGQADPAKLYSWGPGFGKSQSGGRLGDLLLIDTLAPLGTLEGKVDWQPPTAMGEEDTRVARPTRVRITPAQDPTRALHAALDDAGHYELLVPRGSYRMSIADNAVGDPWGAHAVVGDSVPVTATVSAAQRTIAPTLHAAAAEAPAIFEPQGVLFDFDASLHSGKVDAALAELMNYYSVPGVSVALVKDGAVAYQRTLGLANAYTGDSVTDATLFEAASITKIVFAFAVNRMAERGDIDLDRPLHEYLPFEEIADDPRHRKITARHVLSHQTGFPNWRWSTVDGRMHINFHPGTRYGYSGEGFEYLGRVVAKLGGKPLAQVVYDEVQVPMGFAAHTVFSATDDLRKVASRGHFSGFTSVQDLPAQIGVAHSMYTHAGEFANFMLALMARQGLSAQGYASMFEPQVAIPQEPEDDPPWPAQYGLGFHLMESPYGLTYGHGGNNGDFVCLFEVYDEHDVGFIVFTNADTGAKLVQGLRKFLIVGEGSG